ncbi:MAG TPA: hypothetical protein VN577_09000 [Terriglobales bacterium]|nr:hypothetical protein [Terriglobales bacterium]
MDQQTAKAISRWGREKILSDLVNLPVQSGTFNAIKPLEQWPALKEAQQFIARYGPLLPRPAALEPETEIADVLTWATVLRNAWGRLTPSQVEAVNESLDQIFESRGPIDRPTIRTNFERGRWEPVPRHLLDVMALTIVNKRKMLHRCEKPECARYFVKSFSRDKYCSVPCGEEMRSRKQSQWVEDHRDEVNARRRKPQRGRKKKH